MRSPTKTCPTAVARLMVLGIAIALVGASGSSFGGERKPSPDGKTTKTLSSAPGMVVKLDANGKPVPAVPSDVVKKGPANLHEGLKVEQNPAGGITVDLKGRFQQASVAHRDAQGNVRIECVPASDIQATTGGKECGK